MKKLFSFVSRIRIVPRGAIAHGFVVVPCTILFYSSFQSELNRVLCIQFEFLTFAVAFAVGLKELPYLDETFENL